MMNASYLHRLRILVQCAFLLFCLFAGYRFYHFFLWATANAEHTPRPPSVEAFLPIAALMGLKQLVMTGIYDPIHPAGLTIFLAAITLALLLRKGFCGWICPVGCASELVGNLGRWLRGLLLRSRPRPWLPPRPLDLLLLSLKYLLLLFFLYAIAWKMDITSLQRFTRSPYNLSADARMLLFFLQPSGLAATIMISLVLVSLFWRNFWCRSLCPYGALLGLVALFSPLAVKREAAACIDCKKCEKACPASIRVAAKEAIRSPECIGCLECVAVCPQKDCLHLVAGPGKKLPPLVLPLLVLILFFTFWAVALITGHWHSAVPDQAFQTYYRMIGR
ncbi:MAG: 4Fe-4S binding protein [Thermodesulfobacteriota bacterium]